MIKKHNKIIIFISIVIILFCLLIYSLFRFHIVEYVFEKVIMANNPTVFFPCDKFGDKNTLSRMIDENKDEKLVLVRKYLSENNGDLYIETVGTRCLNKYQFVAAFGGDDQRIRIEQLLKDQTIDGIPVFLLNR